MTISELKTPVVVLEKSALYRNIKAYQDLAEKENKEFWPMTKTPKSTWFMKKQLESGATGVLCGTLDECERAVEVGFTKVMYAYPVSDPVAIKRVLALSRKVQFYLRIDSAESFERISKEMKEGDSLDYLLIIDVGLHRFGVKPEDASAFLEKVKCHKGFIFKGITTHPGHVYGCERKEEVLEVAREELNALTLAKTSLEEAGYSVEMVSTGSTPTFKMEAESDIVTHVHPGNYVFHDGIQLALGVCREEDVSLKVVASVISHPRECVYLLDAGAKVLGLDKGAHGNKNITGFGSIKDHPEATIVSLSEEVGVLHAPEHSLEVGERVLITPNHSCSVANLTSFLYLCEKNEVLEEIPVDIRGNSLSKK